MQNECVADCKTHQYNQIKLFEHLFSFYIPLPQLLLILNCAGIKSNGLEDFKSFDTSPA